MVVSPRQSLLITCFDHRGGGGGIDLGRVQLGMPEELLNLLQRHAVFQKRGRDRVPQRMERLQVCKARISMVAIDRGHLNPVVMLEEQPTVATSAALLFKMGSPWA